MYYDKSYPNDTVGRNLGDFTTYERLTRNNRFKVTCANGYIKTANGHVFIGTLGLPETQYINPASRTKIHIFITELDQINQALLHTFNAILETLPKAKVIFHIPYSARNLKPILWDHLSKVSEYDCGCNNPYLKRAYEDYLWKIKIVCERVGPRFMIYHPFYLNIRYEEDVLLATVTINGVNIMTSDADHPIQNEAQFYKPELFKDDIIARFKATTGMNILKQFKDEDDIWDYIMCQGEWAPQPRRDHDQKMKVNITVPEGEDPEEVARNAVDKALKDIGINH